MVKILKQSQINIYFCIQFKHDRVKYAYADSD